MTMVKLRYYLIETFEPTLLYGLLWGALGVAAAVAGGGSEILFGLLAVGGVVSAQIGVNLLDDYFDYKVGIDKETTKTKFSGGSILVAEKKVSTRYLAYGGMAFSLLALLAGIRIILGIPSIIPIVIIGGISVLFYARYMVKVPFLAEIITALNFTLIPVGAYAVTMGSFYGISHPLLAFIAVGMFVGNAIIVNGLPDRKPDKKHGRRSGVVLLRNNRSIGRYHLVWRFATLFFLGLGVLLGYLPTLDIIAFAAFLLISLYVYNGIITYKNPASYEKYMGVNSLSFFALTFILLIAYFI